MIASVDHLTNQPSWLLFLSCIGFLTLLKPFISLVKWVFITFLRPPRNMKKYGSWALVTGATDGIGRAFAYQLAQKGLNLILVSRNSKKLETVSESIQADFPSIRIKIVVLDFSGDISADVLRVEEEIRELDVGILINNVGITYPAARFFHEVDEKVWTNVVNVNLKGTTWITKAVLPGMIGRKRGAIVNIGSGAAIVVPSHPLYTIYAATKAFIDQLSRSLYVEYKSYGIDLQCQVPLYVATAMASAVAGTETTSTFIPSADDYAGAAIRRIGYEARCTPFWAHSLQWCLASSLPEAVLDAWRLSIGLQRRGKFIA